MFLYSMTFLELQKSFKRLVFVVFMMRVDAQPRGYLLLWCVVIQHDVANIIIFFVSLIWYNTFTCFELFYKILIISWILVDNSIEAHHLFLLVLLKTKTLYIYTRKITLNKKMECLKSCTCYKLKISSNSIMSIFYDSSSLTIIHYFN